MIAITPARHLVDGDSKTAAASISLPAPLDVDLAPQLLVITLAQAALAATHRALDSAHPSLASTSRRSNPPDLSDSEHFATLVLHVGNQLADLLAAYAEAIIQENIDPDDQPF